MNPKETELHQKLLELFRQYDSGSASLLIRTILVRWGWKLVDSTLPPSPIFWGEVKGKERARIPGAIFMQKISQMSFKDSTIRRKGSNKGLGIKELETESEKWGEELARFPFDETMQTFVSVAYEWLLTCDLSGLGHSEQGDEEEAMRDELRDWAISFGLV